METALTLSVMDHIGALSRIDNVKSGGCVWALTLQLPRSGITKAMLTQRALKKMPAVSEMEMDEQGYVSTRPKKEAGLYKKKKRA